MKPKITKVKLFDLEFKLYIGDIEWEKKNLQKVSVTLEVNIGRRLIDYWAVSKFVTENFSKTKYLWLEDLALALAAALKKKFKVRGSLSLRKYPSLPSSPKVFEVHVSL